jgi:protein-disulfide isomerase
MKRELKIIVGLAAIVLTGLAIAIYAYRQGNTERSLEVRADGRREELIREDSAALGPKDAPVTVVEFLDPECESCKAFYPIMKEVLTKYDGKVRFAVRYMALHRSSMVAVAATEAAGQQGKYWEMQEHLFATAEEWGHQEAPIKSFFVSYARVLGLDMERFQADFDDPRWAVKVQRDMADGAAMGVKATPTIFVNGVVLPELSQEALESSIERVLGPR